MRLMKPALHQFDTSIYDEDLQPNNGQASVADDPDFWLFV